MGILETRNLDFRNVILLSMNDDNFPGSVVTGTSFIPTTCGRPMPCLRRSITRGLRLLFLSFAATGRERADALLRSCR